MSEPICTHARAGIVTSHHPRQGLFDESIHGAHAATDVCNDPACIHSAVRWVERISGKAAHHITDASRS
jgi:hypothetical protein